MVKQTRGYRVWDPASEDALKAGVRKHGLGAWEHIRKDPQFAILSDRTGVQLKDKWRNLVKFRHIDPDEQRTYKPKTQGPWSKKYKRERTQGLSGTASPASGDGGGASEDEGVQQAGDPQALRQSVRTNAQKRKAISDLALLLEGDGGELYPGSEEEEHEEFGEGVGLEGSAGLGNGAIVSAGEGEGGVKRSRPRAIGRSSLGRSSIARHRKAMEDRRFGIYDRRRYGFAEDGTGPRGRSCDGDASGDASESDGANAPGGGGLTPGAALPRMRRRIGSGSGRRGGGRGISDEDEDDEDENVGNPDSGSNDDAAMDEARGVGGAVGGSGHGGGNNNGGGTVEDYVISCPCGVTYDDGEMMIECESCAAWAHVACLRQQMASAPARFHYNFETYHCSGCQAALHSLQQGSTQLPGCIQADAITGADPGLNTGANGFVSEFELGCAGKSGTHLGLGGMGLQRNGAHVASGAIVPAAPALDKCPDQRDTEADCDTASEDSQRRASEYSTILLGLANGRLGSSGGVGSSTARRGGGAAAGSGSGAGGSGGNFSKLGPFGRSSAPGTAAAAGHRSTAATNGSGIGAGGSPLARSSSLGHTNSGGQGAAAATGGDMEAAVLAREGGSNHRLLRPGQLGSRSATGGGGGNGAGPANSSGSRAGLDGAGSPPPLLDGGLPLFQGSLGGSALYGAKIFRPVPKVALAVNLPGGQQRQPQLLLSAPKARPHPALQRDASQHSLQRMLEAANPLAAAAAAAAGASSGSGGANTSSAAAAGGRGIPLRSVLEAAAGSLQAAPANLCAATGRKAATTASVSNGGAATASDGVGSCDAAAGGGASMPPRPPSRPPSSMAREVANRIFGESDDDDAGGVVRPISALRGSEPWFLMPPSLSRATTPSAFIDSLLRATPDIVPLPLGSPPPHLAAALAAVRSASPGAAYLPTLLAQQQQQQAAIQQFMGQSTGPAVAAALQTATAATAAATGGSASGSTSVLLPPPQLARPTPLTAPPPPFAPPPPLAVGGAPSAWPPGAPPPPPLLHPSSNNGEPVALHPVLRHLLITTAQQQQQQHQQQQRPGDCPGNQQQQPQQQQQQQQQQSAAGSASIIDGSGVQITDEPGVMQPPQQPHIHQSQSLPQQQQQQQHNSSQDGGGRETGAAASAVAAESGSSAGTAAGLVVQPLGPSTATASTSGGGGSLSGLGLQATAPLRDMAMAAAAAAAAAAVAAGAGSSSAQQQQQAPPLPSAPSLDSNGSSVAALLGLGVGGLHLNVLDHLRSSSPDPWGGFFRTSTPGPEAILQSFLPPPPADLNSLPWLKSATPPLPGAFAELLGHPPSAGTDLH